MLIEIVPVHFTMMSRAIASTVSPRSARMEAMSGWPPWRRVVNPEDELPLLSDTLPRGIEALHSVSCQPGDEDKASGTGAAAASNGSSAAHAPS